MSLRAELLADRIEEGLAAFAEGLSEVEWRTPVSEKDRRSVGVIVHHVASVYPIEIDLARPGGSDEACRARTLPPEQSRGGRRERAFTG